MKNLIFITLSFLIVLASCSEKAGQQESKTFEAVIPLTTKTKDTVKVVLQLRTKYKVASETEKLFDAAGNFKDPAYTDIDFMTNTMSVATHKVLGKYTSTELHDKEFVDIAHEIQDTAQDMEFVFTSEKPLTVTLEAVFIDTMDFDLDMEQVIQDALDKNVTESM